MTSDPLLDILSKVAAPVLPERFAGCAVVASVKVADDPTEHPHKHVIITLEEPTYGVHTIAYNGTQWTAGQGRYGLTWQAALDQMAELATRYGGPG